MKHEECVVHEFEATANDKYDNDSDGSPRERSLDILARGGLLEYPNDPDVGHHHDGQRNEEPEYDNEP